MRAKGAARLAAVLALTAMAAMVGSCGVATKRLADNPLVVRLGETVEVDGLELSVIEVRNVDAIGNGLEVGSFALAEVSLQAIDGRAHPYGPQDWRFETLDGSMLEPVALTEDARLVFGTIEPSGSAKGLVGFDLGEQTAVGRLWYLVDGQAAVGWVIVPTPVTPTT